MRSLRLPAFVIFVAAVPAAAAVGIPDPKIRLFPSAVPPSRHPNAARAFIHPPAQLGPAFGGMPARWAGYRGGLSAAGLDAYNASGLGDVVWPQYPVMYTLEDTVGLLQNRSWLWLADISNYVPGDTDACEAIGGGVCEYHTPRAKLDLLHDRLGDRFTGMDNGEQDGRYISYAAQMLRGRGAARGAARREAYLNFRRHFERMESDLGHKLMTLNSLWYPHYLAATGEYTMVGAETAQGLPNDQIFYAFLRGAAKQYGTLVWGDASIGNRWWGTEGPKRCAASVNASTCVCSTNGTSISLLRRLMYSQLLYGSSLMSFEGGLTCTNGAGAVVTSPIGEVQQAGMRWSDDVGKAGLGAHMATAAVMLDFFTGFTPPRHLYTDAVYRTWGGLLWNTSEFFTHGVLDHLYPGYEKASYYHNESGFLTGTPHGDAADVLLSDAPLWLLNQFPVVIFGTELLAHPAEVLDKLSSYVLAGGTLFVTATPLSPLTRRLLGISVDSSNATSKCQVLPAGAPVTITRLDGSNGALSERMPVRACEIFAPPDAVPVATAAVHGNPSPVPLAVRLARGKGSVIVLASSGVAAVAQAALPIRHVSSLIDSPLPNPFPMADHARLLLEDALSSQQPFDAGAAAAESDGLSILATRVKPGFYRVGVSNNGLEAQEFNLTTKLGRITSQTETSLEDAWMNINNTHGYAATHTPAGVNLGRSTASTIAGLDFRMFELQVNESNTELIDVRGAQPPFPPQVPAVALPLAATRSLREQLLLRPTFTQHFSAAVVDWRYVERTDVAVLIDEGRWSQRQGIKLIVDVTSGLNLYPDLRLCNNSASQFETSLRRIESVISKCATNINVTAASASATMFSADVIFSFHRTPENYYSADACASDFAYAARRLSAFAAAHRITLHLRAGSDNKPPATMVAAEAFLRQAGSPPNLKVAVSIAMLVGQGVTPASVNVSNVGMWLAAAPMYDPFGEASTTPALLTNHGSLTVMNDWVRHDIEQYLRASESMLVVLDAAMTTHDGTNLAGLDEEWAEVRALEELLGAVAARGGKGQDASLPPQQQQLDDFGGLGATAIAEKFTQTRAAKS